MWGEAGGQRESQARGAGGGAADAPHLGPGEGPEESGGDTGGAGGLTITEQLLLSLRLSGWPSALSPTLSSGCRARTRGGVRTGLRLLPSASSPPSSPGLLPKHLPPPPPVHALLHTDILISPHPVLDPTLKPALMMASQSDLKDSDEEGFLKEPADPKKLCPPPTSPQCNPPTLLTCRGAPAPRAHPTLAHTPGFWGPSDGNAASGWSSPWSGSAPPHWEDTPRQELRVVGAPQGEPSLAAPL